MSEKNAIEFKEKYKPTKDYIIKNDISDTR